ncbi:MAG: flagellar basal body protein, partial [Candidatus Tectomicrobia bacterium]
MGLSSILDTAQQALFAQQRAIQVTGNNIANVNTEGYSRERPLFVPQTASRSGVLRFGVSVEQVTRAFDQFITTQINTATSSFHGAQTQADLFSQIESLFDDLS